MVGSAISEFGRVDILVNNAGMRASKPFIEMTSTDWREINAVNMDAPFYTCRAVVPKMIERGWGRIINVSGLNAFKGRAEWAHVCAGKMGALGLTRALAIELAPHGIRVNHIGPRRVRHDSCWTPGIPDPPEKLRGFPLDAADCLRRSARRSCFWHRTPRTTSPVRQSHVNGGALTW